MSAPTPAPDNSNSTTPANSDSPDQLLNSLREFTEEVQSGIFAQLQSTLAAQAPKFQEIYAKMRETVASELRESLRQEFQIELQRSLDTAVQRDNAIQEELNRKETEFDDMNRETIAMIEDPDVEIAKVIQRNVKQSELQAYIKGLRYSLGQSEKKENPD
jgi:hypothetical protein